VHEVAAWSERIAAVATPVEPDDSGHLDVGEGHLVYWEAVGTPDGLPAVWLHGGPGAPPSARTRASVDLSRYRLVIFDQRGCGRSRPLASDPGVDLNTNTTDRLVADIELLRSHLGIDRWVVIGGSWGVTLGLVYAQRHPERVLGMVLGAVTSGSWKEIRWITRDMGRVFPREWERFVDLVPDDEREGNLAAAYSRLLASPDQATREEAARRWCEWEDTHMSLAPGYVPHLSVRDLSWQMVFARLVTHYWGHGCFLADNEVQANMTTIGHIPATLIHGVYDVSGPLDTAWQLHKAWPASELVVIDDAGHFTGRMGEEFSAATNAMADRLRPSRQDD
jgi:proline iminopeptidase